jgi:hypothetical protein
METSVSFISKRTGFTNLHSSPSICRSRISSTYWATSIKQKRASLVRRKRTDADRYAQLLQNLAVGIGATREAFELAFGVTLPTAATLNAEFEIITSAIYAAADWPRPAPVTDDKPTTRTHFVYRIDIWTDDGKNILEHLAGLENLIVARAAYRAACERWPKAVITLRQGARIVEDSRR